MFNFTVSLLHFASPFLTTHHKAYLSSPLPQSAFYIILPLFFPFLFFFQCRSTELLHFPFFRHSPPHFSSSLNPGDWSPLLLISPPPLPLCSPCPLRSLCGPSFSGSVWCVSLWSFCATVHPVDRKHPVHHHSQLPVGSAGSVWPICVIFCQITGVWLCVIRPSPNRLPGERGREAGERKVQAGQRALHRVPGPRGLCGAHPGSPGIPYIALVWQRTREPYVYWRMCKDELQVWRWRKYLILDDI